MDYYEDEAQADPYQDYDEEMIPPTKRPRIIEDIGNVGSVAQSGMDKFQNVMNDPRTQMAMDALDLVPGGGDVRLLMKYGAKFAPKIAKLFKGLGRHRR